MCSAPFDLWSYVQYPDPDLRLILTPIDMNSKSRLYVFLDEAGDFNFSAPGTRYFMLTSVTSVRPFGWDASLLNLKYNLLEQGGNIEYFHASEDRQIIRDQVFSVAVSHLSEFTLDCLIVEKRKTAPKLRVEEKFYPGMLGYLLQYVLKARNLQEYAEVIVITDSLPIKRKREAVEKGIKQTLSDKLPAGTRYKILHHSSKSCMGLQIADYCNWAVFRKWERGDLRSYGLIKSAIRSEFDIFKNGTQYFY